MVSSSVVFSSHSMYFEVTTYTRPHTAGKHASTKHNQVRQFGSTKRQTYSNCMVPALPPPPPPPPVAFRASVVVSTLQMSVFWER